MKGGVMRGADMNGGVMRGAYQWAKWSWTCSNLPAPAVPAALPDRCRSHSLGRSSHRQ